jgi:hypothetical protein
MPALQRPPNREGDLKGFKYFHPIEKLLARSVLTACSAIHEPNTIVSLPSGAEYHGASREKQRKAGGSAAGKPPAEPI